MDKRMKPIRLKSISEYHRMMSFPKPAHPLISVINYDNIETQTRYETPTMIFDFYMIGKKRMKGVKYKYGQLHYDFDDNGILFFLSPNQIFTLEVVEKGLAYKPSGWMLLIHPDFIWNTSLAKNIKQYEYFDYAVNEALFLSDKEENILDGIVDKIQHEYNSNIDNFSKKIIVTHIENLLSYSERFYKRQFITREKANHQILDQLEELLTDYFNNGDLISEGLPTVQYVAEKLNVTPSYLGSLLRVLTGQNTQQHIHDKLIDKAKEKLSTTSQSVSEIAYELGFEHSSSFAKLFKQKTNLSPKEFRAGFN